MDGDGGARYVLNDDSPLRYLPDDVPTDSVIRDVSDLPDMPHVKYVGEIANAADIGDVSDVRMADVDEVPDVGDVSVDYGAEMVDGDMRGVVDGDMRGVLEVNNGVISNVRVKREHEREDAVIPDITITVRPSTSSK